MNHPLLDLISNRPQLLVDHAQAYAELVAAEVGSASNALMRRAVLGAAGLGCLALAAVFAGVALMLRGVVPLAGMPAPWLLFAVPVVPFAAGAACLVAARMRPLASPFGKVWWQLKADFMMLREAAQS